MQPDSDPFQVALSAHQEGDIHGAAIAYELILRDDPLHAGAWHLLGVARQQQGCSGEAVECIRRALAIDDSKAVYHNNLGASLLELGLYAEAESAFRRAIELNRDYADAWSNLGRALHLLHSSFEEAERALLGALALRSDHPDALLHLVDVYRDMGRLDDSISLCERFMACHGERPDALRRLGETLAA